MKRFSTLLASLLTLLAIALASPTLAETKPVEVVIGACDAMADKDPTACGYTAGDDGSITGCFKGGPCFDCPTDGSRQCTMLLKRRPGTGFGGLTGIDKFAPPQSLIEPGEAPASSPAAPPPGGPIL